MIICNIKNRNAINLIRLDEIYCKHSQKNQFPYLVFAVCPHSAADVLFVFSFSSSSFHILNVTEIEKCVDLALLTIDIHSHCQMRIDWIDIDAASEIIDIGFGSIIAYSNVISLTTACRPDIEFKSRNTLTAHARTNSTWKEWETGNKNSGGRKWLRVTLRQFSYLFFVSATHHLKGNPSEQTNLLRNSIHFVFIFPFVRYTTLLFFRSSLSWNHLERPAFSLHCAFTVAQWAMSNAKCWIMRSHATHLGTHTTDDGHLPKSTSTLSAVAIRLDRPSSPTAEFWI